MRRLRILLPVLPLLLALVSLALLDASDRSEPAGATPVEQLAPTRLLVLMVDALDRRDVERPERLPRLRARLGEAALHGPVIACVDGVTIPCVSAMVTGFDRVSGFSPLRNFGAARGLAPASVLGALVARDKRVGYFGDPLLARAFSGLTRVEAYDVIDDDATLRAGLAALGEGALDVAFVHLLELDETAHKHTERGAHYAAALARLDARIARALAARAPHDHLVVLGDHGHAETGRHGGGVGTRTYAAYFGPRVAGGVRRMAMTDHARIWARLFGLRWGEPSWIDDALAGTAASASATLHVRPRAVPPLLGVLLVALVLAASTDDPRLARARSRWLALACGMGLGAVAMLSLSAVVPRLWSYIGSDLGALGLALVLGLVGSGIARLALGAVTETALGWAALPLAGALLLALPTAEPTSGMKSPVVWLIALLVAHGAQAARRGEGRAARMALCGAAACCALSLVPVRAYLPRALLAHEVDAWLGLALPALLMVIAIAIAGGARAATLAGLGAVMAWLLASPTDRWLIAPCALILLVTFAAYRRAALFDLACLLLPIACSSFFPDDSAQLASVAVTWLLWAIVPVAVRDAPLLLRGSVFVLLMWLSFWTAMSTRVGGIDYDFYFRWLPANASATSEAVRQGLLTAAKCMLPATFGALLAHRASALPLAVLKCAEHLTRIRLALTLVFVVGLSLGRSTRDIHLLYDATQEVAFWMLACAVLGLIAAVKQVGVPGERGD